MVHTTLTTTASRCHHAGLSSLLSQTVSKRRLDTSKRKSALHGLVGYTTKSPAGSGSGTVWRRYGSTSASATQIQKRARTSDWKEQAEEKLAPRKEAAKSAEGSSRRLKSDLRTLLRDIAQPVAVVTSFMPRSHSHPHQGGKAVYPENGSPYHGATLSSFTSIAMDPYPLVSFALRIPSRMATALSSLSSLPFSSASSAHMVINLLSSSQASTALAFSRPDLFPTPFLGSTSSSASGRTETDAIPYTLSQDGLPIINDVIGALSCELVGGPIALHDLECLSRTNDNPPSMPVLRPGEVASELFIARVVRVEEVKRDAQEDKRTLQPLIYHRRGYTSCKTDS